MKNPIFKCIEIFHTKRQPTFLDVNKDNITIQMNVPRNVPAVLSASIYGDRIHIDDFKARVHGIGYGSKMMQELIDHANENRFKSIDGDIIEYDLNKTKYLKHFYEKFGFKFYEPKGKDYVYYIRLDL